jgi:UDP-GlcNAc:undecaprenyl-phosphate/decaprenyl-phosphate GlcNAc-1-phosphate transferase
MTVVFFGFVLATFVTMVLIPPLQRFAQAKHVLDMPSARKVHDVPIARLGGVAMAAGAILPLVLWAPLERPFVALLLGIAVIVIFGVWDDVRDLDYRLKLAGQLIAVTIVVVGGGVVVRYLPFIAREPLPDLIAVPVTIFALVGVTNAINLADGLDGLAGGITLLSLGVIAVLAYAADSASVVLACAAVIGSVVGFLRFNTYPARIFMGDGGSQLLGFSVGVLVVMVTQNGDTPVSTALPLLILGLPLFDTVLVIIERIYEGRSPFHADRKHVHHRFMALGFDHYEAVFVIYLLQAILVAAAYLLRFESDLLIAAVYLVFCLALVAGLRIGLARGWRLHARRAGTQRVPGWVQWLRHDQRLLKLAFHFAIVVIPGYFFLGAVLVESVPIDVGVLACFLLIVLVAIFASRHSKPFNIVERACLYVAGICVVYLVQVNPGSLAHFSLYRNILFVAMAVAVLIGFRFSDERFRVTPMDFLVVFVALLVPNLPDLELKSMGLGVAMLIVLFYGIELVLNNTWRRWDVMRVTTCVTLAVIGLRGIADAINGST